MQFSNLKRYLGEVTPTGAYLVEGEDDFLRGKAVQMLSAAADIEYPELNSTYLEGDTLVPEKLYEGIGVLPFMSKSRIFVVKEYYPKAQDIALLCKLGINKAVLQHCLLIISNRKKSDIKKAVDFCEVIECGYQDAHTVTLWITAMLRAEGFTIFPASAQKLAELCGRDMQRVDNEIRKLAMYCRGKTSVKDEDIAAIVSGDNEHQVYRLSSLIDTGRGADAFAMIEDFSAKGDSGYVPMFLGLLGNYYRRMYYIKAGAGSDEQLAGALKIKPYAVKMLRRDGARSSLAEIKYCADIIADTDLRIKSGAMTAGTALRYAVGMLLNMRDGRRTGKQVSKAHRKAENV